MDNNNIHAIKKNRDIYNAYIDTCVAASKLRHTITSQTAGNVLNLFNTFKGNFDFLFMLTSDSKDMKYAEALIKEITTFLYTPCAEPKASDMLKGVREFEKYKKSLVSSGMIINE